MCEGISLTARQLLKSISWKRACTVGGKVTGHDTFKCVGELVCSFLNIIDMISGDKMQIKFTYIFQGSFLTVPQLNTRLFA